MTRKHLFACLVLAAVAAAPSVWAAGPATMEGPPADEVEGPWKEGLAAFKRGDYEAARAAFERAYALGHDWFVLRNLAATEMRLGEPLEALTHLELALRDAKARHRPELEKDFQTAYAATGHLFFLGRTGEEVAVDGRPAVPFYERVDVLPGKHAVVGRLGDLRLGKEVEVPAGSLVGVDMRDLIRPSDPARAEAVGALSSASPGPPTRMVTHQDSAARWIVSGALMAAGIGGLIAGGVILASAGAAEDRKVRAQATVPGGVCASDAGACLTASRAANDAANEKVLGTTLLLGGSAVAAVGAIAGLLWPTGKDGVAGWIVRPEIGVGIARIACTLTY